MQKESSTGASHGSRFANRCALRWDALLAENSIIHQQHVELLSKFTPPFSRQQIAELEASAERREKLLQRLQVLVTEWTNEANRQFLR
jgi:hypothetical protein